MRTGAATAGGAAAVGPVVAGVLYDQAGSYDSFLLFAMAPLAIGALLIATLPKPPPFDAVEPTEPAGDFGLPRGRVTVIGRRLSRGAEKEMGCDLAKA